MIVLRKKRKKLELELWHVTKKKPKVLNLTLRREKGKLRPHKFRLENIYIAPKEGLKFLRENNVYVSKDKDTIKIFEELKEMLEHLRVEFKEVDLCRFCHIQKRITFLDDDFYLFHGERICRDCAEREILRDFRYRNLKIPVLPLLERLRDVEKVLMLFNPVHYLDEKYTLYDKIPATEEKTQVSINELKISEHLKNILKNNNIVYLLPIQAIAIENGLLEGENLLVASATASGKTLIGELAGVSRLDRGKFLFLVPLVALANQKYQDFKKKYRNVAVRVGMSRIKTRDELVVQDTEVDKDIIVGTYEGVDFLVRSGRDLGNVSTIVVDEIHLLSDVERGFRLEGLVSRLRCLYPNSQFIALSATVGNAEELSRDLEMKTILYSKRPVVLERHVVFVTEKKEVLKELIEREWNNVSCFGYHGQSIVFSNSRRRCEYLAHYLTNKGLRVKAYHAGLSYYKRKKIEEEFSNQKIMAVVTTAALSAGVDFPASTVIFESLRMGINPLTVTEFYQMLGRAGRPLFHEKGKVYMLIDEEDSETAFKLLSNDLEKVEIFLDKNQELENFLAAKCSGIEIEELNKKNLWTLNPNLERELESYNMIENGRVTEYGRAVSVSFLDVEKAEKIRSFLEDKTPEKILDLILEIENFESVYITQKIKKDLKTNAEKLYSGSILDVFHDFSYYSKKIKPSTCQVFLNLQIEFFNCNCKDTPYCDCGMKNIAKKIVELREKGYSPKKISKFFAKNYNLVVYSGDIFSFLDSLIHKIEALERIAKAFGKWEFLGEAERLKRKIEG